MKRYGTITKLGQSEYGDYVEYEDAAKLKAALWRLYCVSARVLVVDMEDEVELHHAKQQAKLLLQDMFPKPVCTCHERDSSVVCSYCYSLGHRGHMQQGEDHAEGRNDCGDVS